MPVPGYGPGGPDAQFLLTPPPAGPPLSLTGRMPPQALAATTYASAATEASSTVTLPAFTNGDAVYIGYELTAATGTVTVPAGWVEAVPQFRSSSSTSSLHGVLRRVMQPGDSASLAVSHTSGRFAAVAVTVQGADQSQPEDTFATDTNPNSAYPAVEIPGCQPVVVNGLALAWAACRNGTNAATTSFTPPPGFTEFGDVSSAVAATSNAAAEGSSQALTSNTMVPGGNATASSSSGTSINQMGSLVVVRGALAPVPKAPQGPVRAQPGPVPGGRAAWRAGTFTATGAPQAGPPVYPLGHPVQARALPRRGGWTASRAGVYAQAGPPVRPAQGPVRARVPQPVRGGRVTFRAGVFGGTGAPVKPPQAPVAAKGRGLPPRGRTASRTGTLATLGAPVRPPQGPVQARRLPQRGGSTTSRSGVFTAGGPQAGPPVYPWRGPVRTRPQPPPRGRIVRASGTYAGAGPPPVPQRQPVSAARRPLPSRGRTASQRGPYAQAGPPVVPPRGPVRARVPHRRRGSTAIWRAGAFTTPAAAPGGTVTLTDAATATAQLTDRLAQTATIADAATGAVTASDAIVNTVTISDAAAAAVTVGDTQP